MKKIFMAALLFMASVYASESVCAHVQKLYVSNESTWPFTLKYSIDGREQSLYFAPKAMLEIGSIESITYLELVGKMTTGDILRAFVAANMNKKRSDSEKDLIIEVVGGGLFGWEFYTRWEGISKGVDIKWKDPMSKTLPVTRHKK